MHAASMNQTSSENEQNDDLWIDMPPRSSKKIVMSQSCDLANSKLKVVLVCPYWSLGELGEQHHDFLLPKTQEEIRRGYSIPYDFLKQLANDQGKRLRLLSPYKEHLAQAFARVFMRVGLPEDLPPFRGKK